MKIKLITCILLLFPCALLAQTGFNCQSPIALGQPVSCSGNAQYNNTDASQNAITWFKFTAQFAAVTLTVNGAGIGGTLASPSVTVYSDCAGTKIQTLNSITGNVTTAHYEGLAIGQSYYVAVTGQNTGTFKICINNYNIPASDGEDCSTALFIDSPADIHVTNFIGAGFNSHESAGTCLGSESNSTWYKWKAANNGKLVFTLTPDQTNNDIDFVLYDLFTSGDCANVDAAHAIRCAAGSGVTCTTGPKYYKTGLSFDAQDLSEAAGCGQGQDGFLRYVDMIQGHNYGLLINNFSGSSGFGISFKDVNGTPGTAVFGAPSSVISYTTNCNVNKTYTFNNYETTRNQFHWDFGTGATVTDADASGNFTVFYNISGPKTISLTITTAGGGNSTSTINIEVPNTQSPLPPVITANKNSYCIGDTIKLTTTPMSPYTYFWTTNAGVNVTADTLKILVTRAYINNPISLTASNGSCNNAVSSYTPVIDNPIAGFSLDPKMGTTTYVPSKVVFSNRSANAVSYLWDFGDGQTSADINPVHIYTSVGTYRVKLTAFGSGGCSTAVTDGDLIIKWGNALLIPNTFTPNGDGSNDKFNVYISHLSKYHIQIFNRQGKLLFESSNLLTPWDGTYNGADVHVGTYYYIINAMGLDKNEIQKSGFIALLR